MLGSGFIEFKLNYEKAQHLAAGDFVSSDNFSAGDCLWRIKCYPRGEAIDGNNDHVSIYLELVSKPKKVKAIFDAFLVASDGYLWCPTGRSLDTFEFKLNYEKAQHLAAGDFVSSDNFSAGDCLWRIKCYPRGEAIDGNNDHVSIYLELVSKPKKVKAIFDAFLVASDGYLWCPTGTSLDTFKPEDNESGWVQFWKLSDLESYEMNGMITIVCGVIVMHHSTLPVLPPSNLANHLGHLLDCTLGTDVSFIVGGETFPAHRAVLAARSPVFSAELFGPMAHATTPSVTLQDIHPAAFRVMLRFMYTDALPPDDELGDSPVEMLQHLLAAADRFALDRLKVLCELKLWDNTSVKTVASILACAETYNCPKLKKKCMAFFAKKKNFMKAVFTDGFAMLLQKFPELAAELERNVGI